MKYKKIFTSEIVAKNDESSKELERILKDEEIPFFKEPGMFDFTNFKLNLSWVDVKRLTKIGVFDLESDSISLRAYY